jgi:hypothetical protein
MPQPDNPAENLEAILVSLDTLWSRYKSTPTVHDVEYLKIECQTLKERLAKWEDAQPQEAKPTTVAMLEPVFQTPCTPIGRWPGKVDTYPDLYIASVWNYARAARILLTSLMLTISTHLGHWGESHDTLTSNIKVDIQEILSSIPYHLAENLYDFLKEGETEISDPGKTLGGMLIMHPLYIASKAPFLPEETKNYLQRCLSWIASNMGIGQAEILAQVWKI